MRSSKEKLNFVQTAKDVVNGYTTSTGSSKSSQKIEFYSEIGRLGDLKIDLTNQQVLS